MGTKLRQLPVRAAAGAYILSSGLDKMQVDDDRAKQLQSMATEAYPAAGEFDPHTFTRVLGTGEVALGSALLVPIVPSAVAGLGLGAFSAGLVGLYLRTPGAHRQGSLRPTRDGLALAKDVWLLGMAAGLLFDRGSWSRSRRKRKKAKHSNSS